MATGEGLAEWTAESQDWQRKASSAAQYQRARLRTQLSQALAVFPPTALAMLFLDIIWFQILLFHFVCCGWCDLMIL